MRTVYNNVPDLKGVSYDFDTKQFTVSDGRGNSGRKAFTRADFRELANTSAARGARAGESSLRRAVFIKSLMDSESKGIGERRRVLEKLLSWGNRVPGNDGRQPFAKEAGLINLFSRADGDATIGSSKESVDNIAQTLVQGMAQAPEVITVQTASELPFAAPDDVRGAFQDGKIYLVSDNLGTREEVLETVAHELFGHYGLSGFFGDKLDAALKEINTRNPQVAKLAEAWKTKNADLISRWKAGNSITEEQLQSRAIEEAMAQMAESGKTISGIQRLAAVLQELMRAAGLHRLADSLEAKTDAEAMEMLRKARLFVSRGIDRNSKIPEAVYPLFAAKAAKVLQERTPLSGRKITPAKIA